MLRPLDRILPQPRRSDAAAALERLAVPFVVADDEKLHGTAARAERLLEKFAVEFKLSRDAAM